MKRKLVASAICLVIVASGFTAGYAALNKDEQISEQVKIKHEEAVQANLKKVVDDLKKSASADDDYLIYDLTTVQDIEKNSAWGGEVARKLSNSVSKEIERHGTLNYFIPSVFVKWDASEYILGFKNEAGENDILRYSMKDGQYIQVENKKIKGMVVETLVND